MYYHQYQEEDNLPKALGISALVMLGLVAIGFFIVFGKTELPQYGMGGIIVNYGTSEEGMGDDYMSIEEPSVDENANNVVPDRVVPTEVPTPTPSKQVADKTVATQDMEDAPAVTKAAQPVKTTAAETTKEVKNSTPTVNSNALYKGKKNNGTGTGDGTGSTPGNQGSLQGDPLAGNYGDGGSGFGNEPISLSSRDWAVRPKIDDDGQEVGAIVCLLTIDRNGNVTNVVPGQRGSTFRSSKLENMLERELRKGKFNTIPNAPERRNVLIKLTFGVK